MYLSVTTRHLLKAGFTAHRQLLIKAYDTGGQWQATEEAFKQMLKASVQPNVIAYNSLISVYNTGEQ